MGAEVETTSQHLSRLAGETLVILEELLTKHSTVDKAVEDTDTSVVFLSAFRNGWGTLDREGLLIQRRARDQYRGFWRLLEAVATDALPEGALDQVRHLREIVVECIEQQRGTNVDCTAEALSDCGIAMKGQLTYLEGLVSPFSAATYVPDTNALLYNPALEDWSFSSSPTFELVLTPVVLSELDELKTRYQNAVIQQKAERVIRQLKEYRRRGRLVDGVPLRKGRSSVMVLGTEPDFQRTLSWLNSSSADDRMLASMIEVMRGRVDVPVVLVTRDINLQTKAELARIPFCEPPDPTPAAAD